MSSPDASYTLFLRMKNSFNLRSNVWKSFLLYIIFFILSVLFGSCLTNCQVQTVSRIKCMYLSNTTLFDDRDTCIYIENLLHKDQLHVSAFDNGHLQVETEKP